MLDPFIGFQIDIKPPKFLARFKRSSLEILEALSRFDELETGLDCLRI
jgi:hypothetical protein